VIRSINKRNKATSVRSDERQKRRASEETSVRRDERQKNRDQQVVSHGTKQHVRQQLDKAPAIVGAVDRQGGGRLPPYNIEKTGEDAYRLTMAVAGFSPAELDITVQENTLLVTGKAQKEDENGGGYLHPALPGAPSSAASASPTT
jgi:HSP20 family molecular chaperone IbpA